jgi:hypothetical protein
MTWFTETPWPPIFLLGIAACVLLAVWSSQKRAVWLIAALAAVVSAVAVYFIESSIITEAERVEKNVYELKTAFERKDKTRTLSFFSLQAPEPRERVEQALEWVDLPDGVDIKDMSVRMSNENTRAVARFRANGTVSFRGMLPQHAASRWELTWQKEGNDWKIIDVVRLNPINDEPMGIFEPRPQ